MDLRNALTHRRQRTCRKGHIRCAAVRTSSRTQMGELENGPHHAKGGNQVSLLGYPRGLWLRLGQRMSRDLRARRQPFKRVLRSTAVDRQNPFGVASKGYVTLGRNAYCEQWVRVPGSQHWWDPIRDLLGGCHRPHWPLAHTYAKHSCPRRGD